MLYFTYAYLISFIFWGPKLSKKQKIVFASLPLIIINFTRFGYGADYFSYGRIFNEINMSGLTNAMLGSDAAEPLYLGVNYLARLIGMDYHIFAGIMTSVIVLLTVYWLVDYSPNFEWSVLLYFVMHYSVWTLSAIRQGLTMILIFYFIFNKKEFTTQTKVLVFLIAMGFHMVSIIAVVIYLVSKIQWKRKWFLYLLILVPIARFVMTPEILVMFQGLPLVPRLIGYIQEEPTRLLSFPTLVRLVFFVATYIHYDKLNEKHPEYRVLFNFVMLSFVLYFFIPFSMVVATRVTVYGYFLTIIVFPMIMQLYEKKPYKQIVTAGLALFTMFSFYNEFDKMKDRSGYTGSLTMLNTETIFSKDYSKFNRQFALHEQINEQSRIKYKDIEVLERVNSKNVEKEAEFDPNLSHISVYYPKLDMYGIINENGQVVVEPAEYSSLSVFGNVKGVRYLKETNLNSYYYLQIDSDRKVSEEELRSSWLEDNGRELERELSEIKTIKINLDDYKDISLIRDYNMLPVEEAYMHEDKFADLKYLEVKTSYRSYYALLDWDEKPIIDKWYNRITASNKNEIVVASTIKGTEYINRSGEVFWFE